MIVVFVLHLLLAGLLAALAAWFGEAALRRMGLPTRWPWLVGLVLTAVVPLTLAARGMVVHEQPLTLDAVAHSGAGVALGEAGLVGAELLPAASPLLSVPRSLEALAIPLLVLWAAASLVALGRLAAGHAWLRRRRLGWRHARVRDADVSIAPDLGPAVVGVAPGLIVLPHWALEESPEIQQLMVEHERQHVRSRDPWLQFFADAAVALAPWHPALHWLRRRLRAAVEMDCDARVLRTLPNAASRYAELLIAVAGRSHPAPAGLVGAVSLASGSSTLERRIAAMTTQRKRNPIAAMALAGAGILLGVAACETPAIIAPAPEGEVPISAIVEDAEQHDPDSSPLMYGEVAAQEFEFRVVGLKIDSLRAAGRLSSDGPIVAIYDVDGVMVHRTVDLDSIAVSPEAIESIEVLKGNAATRVGAPEGLVYIRLRDSSARSFRVSATGQPVELELRRQPEGIVRSGQATAFRVIRGEPDVDPGTSPIPVISGDPAVSPLYVVDGVVVTDPDVVREMDPGVIKSVEVLKGAAAVRAYGSRAANGGVIVITTRGGG